MTNTEERIASLKESIAQLLSDLPASGPLLTSLHGRQRFARGQCFPRAGALALNTLVAFMFRRLDRLTAAERASLTSALEWWPRFFDSSSPRIVKVFPSASCCVASLFTDGACEDDPQPHASVGAFLVLPSGQRQAFGIAVPEKPRKSSMAGESSQVIGQVELAPVVLALLTWKRVLRHARLLIFVDNDSARYALIRGYSPVVASANLVQEVSHVECQEGIFSWYARVPSASNPADPPSRLDFEATRALGADIVEPLLPQWWT